MVSQSYLVDNHFDRIIQKGIAQGQLPGKTQEARDWYRNAAKQVGYANERTLMKSENAYLVDKPKIGRMYAFNYDAKTKDTLPYWDACPLIFPFDYAEGGFYGLNMHYIDPVKRAKLMDALYNYTNNKRYDESTKIKISYGVLKEAAELSYYKPCLKRYLTSHVKSPFLEIPASDYDIALFLPLARWQKKTGNYVYARSNEIINGN